MRVLAIGPMSNISKKIFSGQSIMFEGFVDYARNKGIDINVIDIKKYCNDRICGHRFIDYIIIVVFIFFSLLWSHVARKQYAVCYYTTSFGKSGVIRDFVIVKLLRLFKVKILAHQFGAGLDDFRPAIDRIGKDRVEHIIRAIDHFIIEGDFAKSQFAVFPDAYSKMTILPNGLPKHGNSDILPKTYDKKDPFYVFYLSNLIYSKGWFDVLQAADIMINSYHYNVKFVFAGQFLSSEDDDFTPTDKNTIDFFNEYVSNHRLQSNVEYYIGLYGAQKDEFFLKSKVFVLPSYYYNEGQPVSILEAMSHGCVPVVTNFRHIPMMVNSENGCFVEAQNPSDIASTIKYLMDNPDIYTSKSLNCIDDYTKRFAFDIYADKIINIINMTAQL